MTSFYGTDNPYRAPTVARDVASFQGAFQEVARIAPPKADVLDFFYQGVQSYEQMFAKQKESYENKANELMAEVENQKAKDIMNGLTSEEVNKRYSEGYMALADSGQINKNLDAYKTLTKNNVSARGAVVGDVASNAIEEWQAEMAQAGNSYVDQQRITEKWMRRYDGTQVGEILNQQARPALMRAQKLQANAELARATSSVQATAALNVGAATNDADSRNEFVRTAFDPSQGPVPPVIDGEGQVTLESMQMLGNQIYQAQFAPLYEDMDPAQRSALELQGKADAAEMAQKILGEYRQDVLVADKMQENLETTANFASLLAESPEEQLADLPAYYPELESWGVEAPSLHMRPETLLQASFSMAGKAVSDNDKNPAAFIQEMWGDGERAFWKQSLSAALETDNPIRAIVNLRRSFPSENVEHAIELGYVPEGTSSEQWNSIRDQFKRNVDIGIAKTVSATTTQQLDAIVAQNPQAYVQQLPAAIMQINLLSDEMGIDPNSHTTFDLTSAPGSARNVIMSLKGKLKSQMDGLTGKKGASQSAEDQRLMFMGLLGADATEQASLSRTLETAATSSGNAPKARTELGSELTRRLQDIPSFTGDAAAGNVLARVDMVNQQIAQGRALAGIDTPHSYVLESTATLAYDIQQSELLTQFPEAADGLLHGSLVTDITSAVPGFRPDTTDTFGLSLREAVGEGDAKVPIRKWAFDVRNQRYSAGLMDQVKTQIQRQNEDFSPEQVARKAQSILTPFLGEDGFKKVSRAASLAGDRTTEESTGLSISTKQAEEKDLINQANSLIKVDDHIRGSLSSSPEEFGDGILTLWASQNPLDGKQDTLLTLGSQNEIALPKNSSYFSSNFLEETLQLSWGAADSDIRTNMRKFSVAVLNDPLAKEEYALLRQQELLNSSSDLEAAINADDNGAALAGVYAQASTRAAAQLMETHGIAADGSLVKFSEGGLDKETHAWMLAAEPRGNSTTQEAAGQSILYGDLEEWADRSGMALQDYSWSEETGTASAIGKPLAVIKSAFRHASVSIDGKDVPFVDYLMKDDEGKIDRAFLAKFREVKENDPRAKERGGNDLQTNLYAMIKAGAELGKFGDDVDDTGLEKAGEYAAFLTTTKEFKPKLIYDENSPSGYSLQLPNLISLPWAAPVGAHKSMPEGRDWPDPIGYVGPGRGSDALTWSAQQNFRNNQAFELYGANVQAQQDAASKTISKYDTNGDGKLTGAERDAMIRDRNKARRGG